MLERATPSVSYTAFIENRHSATTETITSVFRVRRHFKGVLQYLGDCQIRDPWDIRDTWKAASSVNFLVFRFDGKYLAFEADCDDVVHRYAADRTNVDGGVDDGYRLGMIGVFQISNRHLHKPSQLSYDLSPSSTREGWFEGKLKCRR